MKQGGEESKQEFIYAMVCSQEESEQSQVSSSHELFGKQLCRCRNEEMEYSWGNRGIWDLIQ